MTHIWRVTSRMQARCGEYRKSHLVSIAIPLSNCLRLIADRLHERGAGRDIQMGKAGIEVAARAARSALAKDPLAFSGLHAHAEQKNPVPDRWERYRSG